MNGRLSVSTVASALGWVALVRIDGSQELGPRWTVFPGSGDDESIAESGSADVVASSPASGELSVRWVEPSSTAVAVVKVVSRVPAAVSFSVADSFAASAARLATMEHSALASISVDVETRCVGPPCRYQLLIRTG